MPSEKYSDNRLSNQIDWYEKKSAENKKRYIWSRILTILFSALILLLAFFLNTSKEVHLTNYYLQMTVGIIGFLLIVINGWSLVYNHQDKWNHYREVAELLKHEKNLFDHKSGIYQNAAHPNKLLVERVETIISPRHSNQLS